MNTDEAGRSDLQRRRQSSAAARFEVGRSAPACHSLREEVMASYEMNEKRDSATFVSIRQWDSTVFFDHLHLLL